MAKTQPKYPKPLRHDGRICFGIDYFATEAEAEAAAKIVRQRGEAYNGGFFHGMPCGRAKNWDTVVDGKPQYAVTRG